MPTAAELKASILTNIPSGTPGAVSAADIRGELTSIVDYVREKLTANRTYYVNVSTGNDTTGTGASGAPWQTLQKALFWGAQNLDLNGFTYKIELADGTYSGITVGTDVDHPGFQGGGNVWIHGNDTTPENVHILGSSWEAIGAGGNNVATIFVSDCKLSSTATTVVGVNNAILILGRPGGGGRVILGRSAASWAFLISVYGNGRVQDGTSSGLDIDVDTTTTPIAGIGAVSENSELTFGIRSITGTPAWSNAGVLAQSGGSAYLWAFNGVATGLKYKIDSGSIGTSTGLLSSIPGSIEGTYALNGIPNVNIRSKLTANRTYYVRTDGNDANTGLANTAGGAWATPNFARDWISKNIDFNGFRVIVEIADGTYPGVTSSKKLYGGGLLWFKGNHATPANVIIDGTTLSCAFETYGNNLVDTPIYLSGMTLKTTYSTCVTTFGGKLYLGSPDFDGGVVLHSAAFFAYLLQASGQAAQIIVNAPMTTVSLDTAVTPVYGLAAALDGSYIQLWHMTFTNTPAWSQQGINVTGGARVYATGSFTGSATGKKFAVSTGGFINRPFGSGGIASLPGSVDGTWLGGFIPGDAVGEQISQTPIVISPAAALTANTPGIVVNQTWNNAAVAFTALEANITSTASAFGSLLLDLKVDAVSRIRGRKDGTLTLGTANSQGVTLFPSNNSLEVYNYGGTAFAGVLASRLATSWASERTTDINALFIEDGWNNASIAFKAFRMNITDTNSDANSKLMDLQVGGTSKMSVRKDGAVIAPNVPGAVTISTSAPSGGNDGDVWYQVV